MENEPFNQNSNSSNKDNLWVIPAAFIAFETLVVVMIIITIIGIQDSHQRITACCILSVFVGISSLIFWLYWKKIKSRPAVTTTSKGIFENISKSQSIREFQDNVVNDGWRIKMIPFDDPTQSMKVETNGLALIFALIFLISIVMTIKTKAPVYLSGLVIGIVGALIAILKKERSLRANWVRLWAQCVDKELRCILGSTPKGSSGYCWEWRWICEFEYNGKKYQVTPKYLGIKTLSLTPPPKEKAELFDRQVVLDGKIELWVNPKNPLQTELVDNTLASKLYH